MLLQALYSIRDERLLIEQLDYNLLFRWFVGLAMHEEVWDRSTFSKNRKRLLDANILGNFFCRVCEQAQEQGLLSDEYFRVDGTLIEALASQTSFPTEGEGSNGVGVGGDG
jgi:transposase